MLWKCWCCVLCCCLAMLARAESLPAVALYYGANPPLDELKAFDVVVVDPDHPGLDPKAYRRTDSELFAYVSVGEVRRERAWFSRIPPAWLRGDNPAWGSRLVDQSQAAWPAFFAEQVIAPLWAKGYRGFFLDTLDSYQLFAKTPEARAMQEAGMVAVVRELKRRWPEAKLVFNRGFEILPALHKQVYMVAAESLYRGWNPNSHSYGEVPAADREWLGAQLQKVQRDYGLPVLVIDYVPAEKRALARATAQKIREAGFIPYVGTPGLDSVGVGNVEVLPRKVLLIYDPADAPDLHFADPQRYLGMPLAYLGLVPEYLPVDGPLPDYPLTGRYAGIISWVNGDEAGGSNYAAWLARQVEAGLPLAVFSRFGFSEEDPLLGRLGVSYVNGSISRALQVLKTEPPMGFELPLRAQPELLHPVRLSGPGQALLTLGESDGGPEYQPAAITPWGGYVLAPYVVGRLPGGDTGERWYVNPLEFLRAALHLDPAVPVPDVTTENGRRLLLVHIDGDGFVSRAERPGYPYAGEVLLEGVLLRYRLPTTLSVIEGELGPAGLYPQQAPALEQVAREAFALPWVELASHSYSHPFYWSKAQAAAQGGEGQSYHLPIKGYDFSLPREIEGSADYINRRLAPPGKKVKLLLWSGDCVATPEALAETARAGLLNMNGGDTLITRTRNSWTQIAGLGVPKAGYFQVFAPNQNENVYTNLWTGPFYGFERVIETFEMTETPYRFKPVNIYYHLYNVTKTASLNALHKIYGWAEAQPLHPIYASEYIRKVLDFNGYTVARTPTGYRLRGSGELRTVRLPETGPDYGGEGVAGVAPGPKARYLSLGGGSVELVAGEAGTLPYLESANARLGRFERTSRGLEFALQGYQPLRFTLVHGPACRLFQDGTPIKPSSREGTRFRYELASHESLALRLDCGA